MQYTIKNCWWYLKNNKLEWNFFPVPNNTKLFLAAVIRALTLHFSPVLPKWNLANIKNQRCKNCRGNYLTLFSSKYPTMLIFFLHFTPQQLNNKYGSKVPLVLMNSFNTHEETMKTLRKYSAYNVEIKCFNQSCHPRIVKESLLPLPRVMGMKEFDVEWWVISEALQGWR